MWHIANPVYAKVDWHFSGTSQNNVDCAIDNNVIFCLVLPSLLGARPLSFFILQSSPTCAIVALVLSSSAYNRLRYFANRFISRAFNSLSSDTVLLFSSPGYPLYVLSARKLSPSQLLLLGNCVPCSILCQFQFLVRSISISLVWQSNFMLAHGIFACSSAWLTKY